ncbi:MAG: DNA-3-methyladenine glycosylase [Candidatus Sumerlaeaceae bacterium]|nr:DNA-3-methyladenine glycosylase [Candidatus Sumerlaeaceae bacterium]
MGTSRQGIAVTLGDGLVDFEDRFGRRDFQRDTLVVCRSMLGSILVHDSPAGRTAGRIVEIEAYLGPEDRASHTYGGRKTERNRAMHGEKGHAYVYFIYGMHWCCNIVCGPAGKPQAGLVRALEPVAGLDLMRERIHSPHAKAESLCRGPGKLCKAMGITGALYGADLTAETLYLIPQAQRRGERILATPRIGIAYAGDFVDKPWRFLIEGNPSVSRPPRPPR